MARHSTLDDSSARERVYRFCRGHGRESFRSKNCWDRIISKARYFAYKDTHPDFAETVQKACHFYFLRALHEHPERYEQSWKNIDNKLQHGETETKIFSKFTYKENADGSLILDPKTNQPIPDKLIGEAQQQITHKPCSDKLVQWVIDKTDKALDDL